MLNNSVTSKVGDKSIFDIVHAYNNFRGNFNKPITQELLDLHFKTNDFKYNFIGKKPKNIWKNSKKYFGQSITT